MDQEIVNNLINKMNTLKKNINNKINECKDMLKVIIIGVTGSGKSSLTNCLSNQDVIIRKGLGNKIELVGPGIVSGGISGTREPSIVVDNSNNITFFDCPGFEDTQGYIQEIINSFAIDYLLKISRNNKIKILLVISSNELESGRAQGVTNTIDRIMEMFPNPNELQQGIGIVFTKGDSETESNDFIEILNESSNEKLKQWCQFFKTNNNSAFVFPMADKNKVGNQYDFNDHKKLITFLKTNQITNPIHKIALSKNATLYLDKEKLNTSQKVQNTVHDMFINLIAECRKEKSSSKLQNWLNLMNNMKSQNICKTCELKRQFPLNIPNSTNHIKILEENEIIYSFIDEMLKNNDGQNKFKNSLLNSLNEVINELVVLKQRAEAEEENERIQIENERILEENRKREEELRKKKLEMEQEAKKIQKEQEEQRKKQEELEKIAKQNQARLNQPPPPPPGPSNEIKRFTRFIRKLF